MGQDPNHQTGSIHQCISNVLSNNHPERRVFAPVEAAIEVDRLEFQRARARMDLRAAQERVDELTRELERRQARVSHTD